MATFVLRKCKLRDGWLVPVKNTEPVTLEWKEAVQLLAPSKSVAALKTLRMMSVSSFVGLVRVNGQTANFLVRNADLSGDVRATVKRDPSFADRLVDAYRVESVDWEDRMIERSRIA
jgi:hypothetical protein